MITSFHLRKEKLPFEYLITLEFDNFWFMDFKYIPINEISRFSVKYNKEILKIVKHNDNNTQRNLTKSLLKILKNDLSKFDTQNLSKSHNIKVRDSYSAKKFCYGVTMNEISFNQVEFTVNIENSAFEEFSETQQDLISYLNIVLDKIFFDCFNFE